MKKTSSILFLLIAITGILFDGGCKNQDTPSDTPLTGVKWILESITYSQRNVVQIVRTFSAFFKDDGGVDFEVDCNLCYGAYTLGDGDSISFADHMNCTEAYCGDDSRDTEFHAALDSASKYDIRGNRLLIYFNNENSTLDFTVR